ncbi:hypothetical protein NE865_07818 [Phthorimaea operculella]|nr:hypothetical protein NE865_07818 [Phthorimaea operculella]
MDTSALLANNKADLDQLFSRMGEFEIRLKNATASPALVHTDLKTLASEYADFKNLVWQALTKISAQTNLLSLGLERHEAFMRRKVLLFHGVTESKEEKLAEVIAKVISDKMQLSDITSSDLQACHRLGSSSTKTRPVLVRFRDLDKRREVWDSKTALKNTGMVISEFLTKSRHDLFVAARKYRRLYELSDPPYKIVHWVKFRWLENSEREVMTLAAERDPAWHVCKATSSSSRVPVGTDDSDSECDLIRDHH